MSYECTGYEYTYEHGDRRGCGRCEHCSPSDDRGSFFTGTPSASWAEKPSLYPEGTTLTEILDVMEERFAAHRLEQLSKQREERAAKAAATRARKAEAKAVKGAEKAAALLAKLEARQQARQARQKRGN